MEAVFNAESAESELRNRMIVAASVATEYLRIQCLEWGTGAVGPSGVLGRALYFLISAGSFPFSFDP